jgi:hypothetical protein
MASGRRMASMEYLLLYNYSRQSICGQSRLIMTVKELIIHVGQVFGGVFAICFSIQRKPLRGRDGKPFSNQKFMRVAFFVVGLALFLGGLVSLGLAWYISSSQPGRFFNL